MKNSSEMSSFRECLVKEMTEIKVEMRKPTNTGQSTSSTSRPLQNNILPTNVQPIQPNIDETPAKHSHNSSQLKAFIVGDSKRLSPTELSSNEMKAKVKSFP